MFSFMQFGPATAYLFPGQGGQHIGMAQELCQTYPAARLAMEEADDTLGFAISKLCFQGPEETLTDTINAQPAILAASVATLHAIQQEFEQRGETTAVDATASPSTDRYAAGHSFGEYTALVATGSIRYADGLRLVRERGRLMKEAGSQQPGMMAAILGMDNALVAQTCAEILADSTSATADTAVLSVANDNCPGQVVISGDRASVERAMAALSDAGARKIVPLAVSIAAHSSLMQSASAELAEAIQKTPIVEPNMPIIGNTTAQPMTAPDEIRQELVRQLTSSVRWTESMQFAANSGIAHFVEIGPGDALTGMMKRIARKTKRRAINEPAHVQEFVADLVTPAA